ncbi:DoxX family membrane protein [Chlorobium phaeobacteroides]|jgi:thiosulfate dehydrogenase [quinone] large subunit|uniref:DoxX family protein n=1 Tax=Chlorobium phaeobacteroides (strain DSM 266 / SMG 266 / 2430) TaxID=290317 RepID=A1BGN8_CHLPD|nr:DoxX family membrane protein [Chlorobium phaeobacteroides]ABL65565.1 DoxX family protein [Chlorobium phaeobacteroides DSM 266]MBV5326681.1 DoxX family membrane protein [Chlorobium sp.]
MDEFRWNASFMKEHPLKTIGVILFLVGRYIFAAFFLYGFWFKLIKGWLWSDLMNHFFTLRFTELPLGSFQSLYLEHFAIPLAMPIAWIVTIGELIIGLSLLLGLCVRANAAFALFLVINFAAGGFYNLTLPPFMIFSILMMLLPSGQWLGLDKKLHLQHPDSIWFR